MKTLEAISEAAQAQSRRGRRLLQIGSLVFLFALLTGLVVQKFTVPRLGLSAHLLGLMQGLLLMVAGLFWTKLKLSSGLSSAAFCLIIYGCLAALSANLLGAIWGAGNSLLPLAAGSARGSSAQELVIMIGLRTAAVALIASLILILWGLRMSKDE